MPINTLGANYESSCFKVNPVVSRLGPQTTTVKSGHVLPMISERKQSQKFSDTDLAKVAMQDTQHHQQKHPSSSASILPSSVDGSSKEWHVSLDSGKSRNSGGNTTERVPVASSEHVAEIVGRQDENKFSLDDPVLLAQPRKRERSIFSRNLGGGSVIIWGAISYKGWTDVAFLDGRQTSPDHMQTLNRYLLPFVEEIYGGSKIKALRAKTNTYIKTPVRGEEPVFVVTGRADDVIAAKMEILSVAEHFDHVMALNKARPLPAPPSDSDGDGNSCQDSTANHVTVRVRVPYRVVGLLVGPKGATIKRIQLDSQTYIVTPSRDKEPIFEITGTPENVERAKAEIEGYIALRTGIADLASLQHQPTAVSPHQQQQQQQQQQHLSKFLLPPLNYNDFSTLLNGHGSASSGAFSALQLLSSLNGLSSAPNDICGAGGINSVGQTSNPQLINSAAAAVLGVYSQPAFKSSGQGKGVLWSDVKTEPKAWPSTLTEVIGSGLPSWFANSNSVTNQCTRHFAESGVRKMSLGSCRETPVCAPCKSYHDDLFDMSVLNPSGVFGSDAPMLNGSVSIADLCSYDRLNAFGAVGICNSNNNDNHLIKNSNYLNTLLNSSAINSNTSGNKNLASLDQRLLTTILSLKHSGSSLSTTSNVLQPQQPFGCCDFAISDFNNNINGCGCGFGCACSICSGGSLEYPRNSLLLTSMMMGSPNSCEGRDSKYKDDRTSEASFHNSNSALPGLNLFSGHFFSDSSGKQNQSPYTSLQRDGDTGLPFLSDRTQDEVLRFGGIMESTIMAFSDISSNSNSSSSSSPTDVTERTAY